jgi:hypothetical protein
MKYDINDLAKMLTYKRPAGSATEEKFISTYIDRLYGIRKDGYGNRILKIGNSDVAFSCHTDTVHHTDGFQEVHIDDNGIARTQRRISGTTEAGSVSAFTKQPLASTQQVLPFIQRPGIEPLGADDTAGVWLMLNLAEAGVPGLYLFHRNEEHGGLGSEYIKKSKSVLKGIKKMIAFDRRGFDSIITHQRGQRCCSDEFAKELSRQLGWYRIDTTGVFTDSANYMYVVPECTNVSVGYEHEHSVNETQDLVYAEQLYQKLRRVDWNSLPIVRKLVKEKKIQQAQPSQVSKSWDPSTQTFVDDYGVYGGLTGYEGWRDLNEEEYQRKVVIDVKANNKKKQREERLSFKDATDWECPNCHEFMNYNYDYCTVCGVDRPSKKWISSSQTTVDVHGAWECKWCHTTNYPQNKVCWKCNHKKGTQPKKKESPTTANDYFKSVWKCDRCGMLNSKQVSPKYCSQCGAPKTSSPATPMTVSPNSLTTPMPSNYGDWKCPKCGAMNSMFVNPTFCRECSASKNQSAIRLFDTKVSKKEVKKEKKKAKKSGYWICGYCGTRNALDDTNCIECNANRYSGRASVYNLGREKWFMGGLE